MSSSSSPPFGRRRKSWARRIERCCCGALSYFPLTFVYGLLTWAAWVEVSIGFWPNEGKWTGKTTSLVGFILYALAASSYTVAVSKDPGSPITSSAGQGYSALPRHETPIYTSLTAKSSGKPRYCKKCHTVKPDRAHHCSSCNRCVLKMDHHCPWLATCVGMYNYKAFILFLSYTTLFSWLCFATATEFVWRDIFDESKMEEGLRIVNVILLAVLGGIIGLVLGGFTAWHVYLATDGKTTIESLEKTRYLNPLKKSMENQVRNHSHSHNHNHNDARHYLGDESTDEDERTLGEQLKEIHANALPGVTRPEEGETRTPTPSRSPHSTAFDSSPASDALRRNYASLEADRERERYSAYLDEQDSEKLPHAFDLGWRRNLLDLFGPKPLYWFLPICNTKGDGWTWEVSANWSTKRDELAADRALREEAERRSWRDYQAQRQQWHGGAPQGAGRHFRGPPSAAPQIRENHSPQPEWSGEQDDTEDVRYLMTTNGVAHVPLSGRRSPGKAEQLLGKSVPPAAAFSRRKVEDEDEYEYDTSSDDEEDAAAAAAAPSQQQQQQRDWNDVPEEFLTAPGRSGSSRYHRDRSGGRTKGD